MDSVLDVGCGSNSPVARVRPKPKNLVGLDGFLPSIEKSRSKSLHDDYKQVEFSRLGQEVPDKSYDAVVALDVIEHFEKPQGLEFLSQLERMAKKRVILFTPNGFLPQQAYDGNEFQVHRSGWSVSEMRARGYRVVGINGLKPLRGEMAEIQFHPKKLGLLASWATQPLVARVPELAFQILCVKEISP